MKNLTNLWLLFFESPKRVNDLPIDRPKLLESEKKKTKVVYIEYLNYFVG